MIAKYGNFEYALADRYRFEAELGRGAMGTVFRARDLRLDRAVAIKMLHATLTNDLGILRFQSEIRIAASLHHPSIVAIHDSGEADGRLFYVMEHLDGETLRARLQREKQLSVDDALRIAEQVADALQFAHDRGVVHRDIKPENILLADGRARVVDFGLARALGDVDAERLTASGLSVGTPQYLSPEQASAEKEVGPRADQYGLACVLYEMLAGEPPFTGPTATAVAMKHISEIPAALSRRRRTTPAAVEACVMRALEKVPADRFGSVREFAAALRGMGPAFGGGGGGASVGAVVPPGRRRFALPYVIGAGVLTIAVIGMIGATVVRLDDPGGGGFAWWTDRSLDTTRYAVLPFATASTHVGAGLDDKIRDALGRWDGISVAGGPEMQSAAGVRGGSAVTANDGRAIARAVGAGRYVMGDVTSDGGAVRIRAEALDATGRTAARSASVVVSGGKVADLVVSHLVYQLLYGGDEARRDEEDARGTTSRVAFEDYLSAREAMREWNLTLADSMLARALAIDGSFAQASLALAETRSWRRDDPPGLDELIARARGGPSLSSAERTSAAALEDLRVGRFPTACARYDSLVARDSLDFAGWYGLGECNRRDRAVIADKQSPSGMSFRGSYLRASVAFARAFALLPRMNACCEMRADSQTRSVLLPASPPIRFGRGLNSDSILYGAYPELFGDTVGFIPRPINELDRPPPATYAAAVKVQERARYDLAAKRVSHFTNNSDALAELGEAMESLGLPGTVDTVRRARALASNPDQKLHLAIYEIWLRLKVAVPGDIRELAAIRTSAESLVTSVSQHPDQHGEELASVAVLLGEVPAAVNMAQQVAPDPSQPEIPRDVYATSKAFLVYAAAGGPADSLRELETRLTVALANRVQPQNQAMARAMLLSRAATLAFPVYRATALAHVDSTAPLGAAELHFARGDTVGTRVALAKLTASRKMVRPADVTLDALYPEAWLRAATGDVRGALSTIAPALDALRFAPAEHLFDIAAAGSLVRAMQLRADLANRLGDTTSARRWARAVTILTQPRQGMR